MGDSDRKDSRKRRHHHHHNSKDKEEKSWTTPTVLLARNDNDKDYKSKNADINKLHSIHESSSQPTIILKTRDGETRALSPNQSHHVSATTKQKKESDLYNVAIKSKIVLSKAPNSSNDLLNVPVMTRSILIKDGIFTGDGVLDYLTEHNEFLVVGCLGLQGVGKSIVMSELCGFFEDKREIFKTQNTENLLMCSHCTSSSICSY